MKNIFLTGNPGIGKTTVIKEIVSFCSGLRFKGFYTSEIREKGRRTGFKITTFSGKSGVLSHINVQSSYRVSKYKVNLSDLENIGVNELTDSGDIDVFVVDEIGKMEVFSEKFCFAVNNILNSKHLVIGTISKRGAGFIKEVRDRNDVELIEVTFSNRDRLPVEICNKIKSSISAK